MKGLLLPREIIRSPLSGSVRARVVALGLIAAIPAAGMAGIIAGQDYRTRERVAIERVDRLQGLAAARVDVAAVAVGASLSAIGGRKRLATRDCGPVLAAELGRVASSVRALALFDADGALLCSAGEVQGLGGVDLARAGWFVRARAGGKPVLDVLAPGPWAAAPVTIVAAESGSGVLAAVLPADWFSSVGSIGLDPSEAAIWLFDPGGRLVASSGLAAQALPPVAALIAMRRGADETLLCRSAAGVPYAYATTRLPDGWQIIGAYRSAREHAKALRVLYTRLADLAALLLLGLAITVLGADIAFGDPLRRLRAALAAWQGGAAFDESGLATAPTELVDLAHSFNEATASLREQNAELERGKERQELLMLEIHHRVKNNLQIVASLLNLQASRIRAPEARAEFQSARDRVRALATLHRHLYSEGEINTINMPSFLNELCGQLFAAMGETVGERLRLVIEAEELRLSTDQAVPLALIVTEAVTNAIKYGFPGGLSGTVSIQLAQHGHALDLVIADDGVGIAPGRAETESGTRDGIGLQLIRGFSRQLDATLVITHDPGTRYTIHMPIVRGNRGPAGAPGLEEAG